MRNQQTCVTLLLEDHSEQKVTLVYANNLVLQIPKSTKRPPYYANPRCEPYKPLL